MQSISIKNVAVLRTNRKHTERKLYLVRWSQTARSCADAAAIQSRRRREAPGSRRLTREYTCTRAGMRTACAQSRKPAMNRRQSPGEFHFSLVYVKENVDKIQRVFSLETPSQQLGIFHKELVFWTVLSIHWVRWHWEWSNARKQKWTHWK